MHNSGSRSAWKVPLKTASPPPPVTRGVQAGDETAWVTSEVPLDFRGCDPDGFWMVPRPGALPRTLGHLFLPQCGGAS